ncbi:methyltransferase [Sphingomonas pseudosanguinis]|uniref:methyltransferase n=1 Tax=Sphingomonas pseudosanguinis TaxID=413712 RepID=UPI003F8718C7
MIEEKNQGSAAIRAPIGSAKQREGLLHLLQLLEAHHYTFVTPTPATHARVLVNRGARPATDLRDILGWSLPFSPSVLDAELRAALAAAEILVQRDDGLLQATLRVSRVEGTLFLHSAYPTTATESVFLGPDSYRFAKLIIGRMDTGARHILDYGAGAGVGGIVAARVARGSHLTLADINPRALFLASINAEHAGVAHSVERVSAPKELTDCFDQIVTHPPFMIDADRRAYRDGGNLYGGQLSLDWTLQALALLKPKGRLILHTGASVVDGQDVLRAALAEHLPATGFEIDYSELDPDIFGDELEKPTYVDVERIAAVGLVVRRVGL